MNNYIIILFSLVCLSATAQSDSDVIRLADPAVFSHKGVYYLYGTVEQGSDGFTVYTSVDLQTWSLSPRNGGYALRKGEAFGDKGFWAPQVFEYKKKFYMAYVANEEIAIAEADSPLGPFTQKNKVSIPASTKQIDPFILVEAGKLYLYHVRLTKGNRIFVAELSDDLSAIKEYTLKECISAEAGWENTRSAEWPVAEGPSILKRNGLYYLFYSANDFRNPDYAVGYATSKSPFGPWKKSLANPIISRTVLGVNGPGHGDFFLSKNNQLNYVLHTHNSDKKVGPRKTAVITMQLKDAVTVDKNNFRFLKFQ
jgi:xylan 1,4-beta-xylosidase